MAKQDTAVLERGSIYFVYRPKVGAEAVEGIDDVQRLYLVLSPDGGGKARLAIIGRKRLSSIGGHERNWGFVDMVGSAAAIEKELRGDGRQQPARPVGEGVYIIARHGDHTHLAYELELPRRPGEAQEDLHIEAQGSYILTIKNPSKPSPRNKGLAGSRKADLPKSLRERFQGRRFVPADPPGFLDHEGAEFVLVGAKEDPERELNVEIEAQCETEDTAEIFNQLNMTRERHPVRPLLKGHWQ